MSVWTLPPMCVCIDKVFFISFLLFLKVRYTLVDAFSSISRAPSVDNPHILGKGVYHALLQGFLGVSYNPEPDSIYNLPFRKVSTSRGLSVNICSTNENSLFVPFSTFWIGFRFLRPTFHGIQIGFRIR